MPKLVHVALPEWYLEILQHDIVYLYFLSLLTCLVKYYIEGLFYAGLFYFCQTVSPAGNVLTGLSYNLQRMQTESICKKNLQRWERKENLQSFFNKAADQHVGNLCVIISVTRFSLIAFNLATISLIPDTALSLFSPFFHPPLIQSELYDLREASCFCSLMCYAWACTALITSVLLYVSCHLLIFPHSECIN